jgi:hypothetical protein
MKKKKTVSQLKRSLDKLFSIFIRMRDKGICYTCGSRQDWKYQQNGHFISRGKMATRYDEKNCHCQCVSCNVFQNGRYPEYAERLIKEYGEGIISDLVKKGRQIKRFTTKELEESIEHYKNKIKELN